MKEKIKIAVVTGGTSAELEVSLKSAAVVMDSLNKDKYEVHKVDITSLPWKAFDGKEAYNVDLNTFSIKEGAHIFDFAFIAIHGTPAEDGKIQGYFDLLKIPYSASSVLASAITFDKAITKQLVKAIDVSLAKSILLTTKKDDFQQQTAHLSLPLFVKPNKNGSSYGVSKVKKREELEAAVFNAFQYDDEILVEEFIDGRELASGILQLNGELICLPITEIISENEFFDYEAKYLGKSKEVTPANISESIKNRCHSISKQVYRELKLSGAARVDYFLKGEELYLLEVNTIPGLSVASLLPQQALAHGFSLREFFDIVITEAMRGKYN